MHSDGVENPALGRNAPISSMPGDPFLNVGIRNTALRDSDSRNDTYGYHNTAVASGALINNTRGTETPPLGAR